MADRIVTPGSDISPDTSVVGEPDRAPSRPSAGRAEPDPEALIAGNRVSTGRELEVD